MVYPRQHSNTWYLKRRPYRIFMVRELSALFLAGYMVLLTVIMMKVHEGPAAFAAFTATLRSPGLLVANIVMLVFSLFHTVTWFQAVPKAMPVRMGEEKVPPQILIGMNYVGMLAIAGVVLALALVG